MINYILPLPHRAELLGSTITGLVDNKNVLMPSIRTAISREIAVLPIRFYKIISQWGRYWCEHVVATDSPVNILNLRQNQGKLIPISVKIKDTASAIYAGRTFLFVNGINYLLTKYPKEWKFDQIVSLQNIITPHGVIDLEPITVWCMKQYTNNYCGEIPNVPSSIIDVPDKHMCAQPVNLLDPYWSLIEANDSCALELVNAVGSGRFSAYGLMDGLCDMINDIIENQECGAFEFFVLEFHKYPFVDPITKICLNNPWFFTWDNLQNYFMDNPALQQSYWNLAIAQANATCNFKGSTMPILFTEGECSVYEFLSTVINSSLSDFTIELSGSCTPRIAINDPFYSGTEEYLQKFAQIVGYHLDQLFISLAGNTPSYLKGHAVTITKNFLDEIFIVVEGVFGHYCYYVPIPYYCLVSPVLCNVTNLTPWFNVQTIA